MSKASNFKKALLAEIATEMKFVEKLIAQDSPNEAAESARTRGSRPAERQNERETPDSQLAPVLRPDCVAGSEHVYIVYSYDAESIHMECSECRDVWHVNVR
jgi:hypothetical protein